MASLPKVLLVEDDGYVSNTLVWALKNDYDIEISPRGKTALYKTDTEDYDQIILDLNLPDISGLDVCSQMRHRGVKAPILILSAESKILTKVNLLDAGANDYLTKPFALGELKARLRALARVERVQMREPNLALCGVILDKQTRRVERDGIELKLRRKEFELLACLMENANMVVRRQDLIDRVWNEREDIWTNTIDVHINNLRQKLDKPFSSALIHTVHGLGYKFEEANVIVHLSKGGKQ